MRVLVGLGNPGPAYVANRHNIGFSIVDRIADDYDFGGFSKKFDSLFSRGQVGNLTCLALKPMTYMNRSGLAVGQVVRFYKLSSAEVCVFHDDIDLAVGQIKIKRGGSPAGHNGLKSIDGAIGQGYQRIRIGVGRPAYGEVNDHVMGNFSRDERSLFDSIIGKITASLQELIADDGRDFSAKAALIDKVD